ncbi:MAG: accessory gene regulator B family protein [Lachnospiraceae bacterium]|nr:accessory gene regulator B family protein [Lachnospiraceae bacterium]
MAYLMDWVKNEYDFTDYQIRLIRYTLTAILYDVSKVLLFAVYFYFTGQLIDFIFAVVPLILLRTKTGGIHMKKYWSCLLFSFAYLYVVINILPQIATIQPLLIYLILLICALIDYYIGPTSLKEKPSPGKDFIKKAKMQTFQAIFLIAILFFIFPENRYLLISFWTVVLHTFQLAITKLVREVKYYEKLA